MCRFPAPAAASVAAPTAVTAAATAPATTALPTTAPAAATVPPATAQGAAAAVAPSPPAGCGRASTERGPVPGSGRRGGRGKREPRAVPGGPALSHHQQDVREQPAPDVVARGLARRTSAERRASTATAVRVAAAATATATAVRVAATAAALGVWIQNTQDHLQHHHQQHRRAAVVPQVLLSPACAQHINIYT